MPTGRSSAASDVPFAVCWGSLASSTSPGLELPDHPLPATPVPHTSTPPPQGVSPEPQGIFHFQNLDRRISSVGHPDVHARRAIRAARRPLPAADRLVVRPAPPRPPVPPPPPGHRLPLPPPPRPRPGRPPPPRPGPRGRPPARRRPVGGPPRPGRGRARAA